MDSIKPALKLLLLAAWIGLCCLPAWLAARVKKTGWRDRVVCSCYRGILRIIGVRLQVSGVLSPARPLLLVTNHISYLDVALLGSQHAFRFTPKSDIAAWPAIGGICRLCGAVFIDRRPEKLADMKHSLQSALASGAVVSLFPEASTGNGLHMLPFKSGFFSLASEPVDGRELTLQPAAIRYTHIRRLPVDTADWPHIAWYGDMEMLPHLWEVLKLGPISAELVFLPPVTLGQCGDRKRLAAHCQQAIAAALQP